MAEVRTSMAPEALVDDHWQQVRCERGRRVVDINHHRQEVRWACDKCRTTHTAPVGVRYDEENVS